MDPLPKMTVYSLHDGKKSLYDSYHEIFWREMGSIQEGLRMVGETGFGFFFRLINAFIF